MNEQTEDEQTTMQPKLLPCPFCGGLGRIYHDTHSDYARHWRYVPECTICETEGRHCATEDEAVTWWNTRYAVYRLEEV